MHVLSADLVELAEHVLISCLLGGVHPRQLDRLVISIDLRLAPSTVALAFFDEVLQTWPEGTHWVLLLLLLQALQARLQVRGLMPLLVQRSTLSESIALASRLGRDASLAALRLLPALS